MTELNREQYAALAQKLQDQRHELLEQVRQQVREYETEEAAALESQLNDVGDLSVADLLNDMRLDRLDRETEQLREIEKAELRMKTGHYGICIDCDQDIKLARLQVQPAASRCISCQELYERTHATRSLGHQSAGIRYAR